MENGRITVDVEHFSTYILLNKVEFDKVWNEEIKKPITGENGEAISTMDVVFVVDVSGSMSGTRINTAKEAIREFNRALSGDDRSALVAFNTSATVYQELTTRRDLVNTQTYNLYATGQTAMYKGFEKGLDMLTKEEETYGYKMIIVLSDGKDEPATNYDSHYAHLTQQAADNGIVVYTIGVGTTVDTTVLTKVAEGTGGNYYHTSVASQIKDKFEEVKEDTIDLTADKNNDGIPDYYNDLIRLRLT